MKISYTQYKSFNNAPELIYIDPYEIKYNSIIAPQYIPITDKAVEEYGSPLDKPVVGIMGGPWDKLKINWFDDVRPRAIYNRFINNVAWEDTDYYSIKLSGKSNKSKARVDVDKVLKGIDLLYYSMNKNGYIHQMELIGSDSTNDTNHYLPDPNVNKINGKSYPNECRVGIGRNGEIIRLKSAKNRVTIAKLVNVKKIPVIIVLRHSQWMKIRDTYKEENSLKGIPDDYRKFSDHPDIPF